MPVSPQCPSVCQPCHVWCSRAQRSPASTHNAAEPEMLATTWGVSRATSSAFSCRCVVPGYRTSRSDYTRGQSRVDCRGVPEVCVGGKAYHYRISFEMVTASVVDLLSTRELVVILRPPLQELDCFDECRQASSRSESFRGLCSPEHEETVMP